MGLQRATEGVLQGKPPMPTLKTFLRTRKPQVCTQCKTVSADEYLHAVQLNQWLRWNACVGAGNKGSDQQMKAFKPLHPFVKAVLQAASFSKACDLSFRRSTYM